MKPLASAIAFGIALCVGGLAACAAAADAAPVTLRFQVRGDATDQQPTCAPEAAGRCRDDLDLQQVFAALRAMAQGKLPDGFASAAAGVAGVEVKIGPGRFRLTQELALTGWNGAGPYGPLLIQGSGAGHTIVTGALAIPASAWQPVPTDERRLTGTARQQVRVADLGSLWRAPTDVREKASGFGEAVEPVPLDVYAAGRPLPLARWPSTGWALTAQVPQAGGAPSPRVVRISAAPLERWRNEPALRVVGYFSHDWAFERIPATIESGPEPHILLGNGGAKFGVRAGQRVFVENALAALDSPGQWYFDAPRHLLYLWRPDGVAAGDIEIAVARDLLRVAQSSGVTVRGLSLQGARGDAVNILASRNVTFADAEVRSVANRAVIVDGGHAVVLRGLVISDVGEGGIVVSGGNRRELMSSGHVVEACRIERVALRSHSYRPAIMIEGVGVQILRNHIADGPHSAIIFGGNDHRIEGNQISDVVTETNDAGAIYTGRDWTTRGTVIVNNLLQNIYPRLPGAVSVMGIYLDDQASGTSISGNVFANVSRAVFIGGGRDNVVERNIFVASSPAVFADNRGLTWQRQQTLDPNSELRRRFRNMPVSSQPYSSRYANLADILDDEPGRSKYNRVSGNLYVDSRASEFMDGAESGIQFSGNRAAPWTVFKTLRGAKARYVPQDFVLASDSGAVFPDRSAIAP